MKRTRWYSGEQKPIYVGVYERKFGKASGYYPNTTFFTRWNGENWSKNRVTVDSANAQTHWAHLQHLPWRGVSQTTPERETEMSDTPIVWVMTQYLKDETKKPTYCSVVAKLDYDILAAELAACSAVVDRQQEMLDRNTEQLASKQAKIDALMFEHCPEEMTEEQVEEWKKHQVVKEEGK